MEDAQPTACVKGIVERAEDVAVRIRGIDVRQVLGDGAAGDGEAVAVEEAGVEKRPHHHGDASDAEDIRHDVSSEGLEIAQVGDLVGDGVEVVEGELDVGLSRDGQQVEDRVGGPAQCHDDGDGVEEGLAGDDVAGGDAAFEEPHHGLAGLLRIGHPVAVDGRGSGAARQGHAHGLRGGGHGVGGVHATARALTGADGAFDDIDVLLAE